MPVRLGTGPVRLLLDKILKFIRESTLNRVKILTNDLTHKTGHLIAMSFSVYLQRCHIGKIVEV